MKSYLERKTENLLKANYIQLAETTFARIKVGFVRIVDLDIVDESYDRILLTEDEVLLLGEKIKEARAERNQNQGI